MSDVPTDLLEALFGRVSEDLVAAWNRGVCDGIEQAIRMTEELLAGLDTVLSPQEVVRGLAVAMRQFQLQIQLDGLDQEDVA